MAEIQDKYEVDSKTGCWVWIAAIDRDGYGRVRDGTKVVAAHRYVYEEKYGPVPINMCVTTTCLRRDCINPNHLKAMSKRAILLRGDTIPAFHKAKKSCKWGHPFSLENTYYYHGERRCKACQKERMGGKRTGVDRDFQRRVS